MEKHTFAIIAYKESAHLQECINSLLNQTIKSKIVICTSTPSVFLDEIAAKNKLELFINPKRVNVVEDWNFALEKADTDFVTLAHQDDIYHAEYAKEFMAAAQKNNDALILFSDYDEIVHCENKTFVRKNSLNFFIKRSMLRFYFCKLFASRTGTTNAGHPNQSSLEFLSYKLTKNKKRLLTFGNPISCPTVAFNKPKIGAFKFDDKFSVNMDWKAWLDLAQKEGAFVWIRKILVSHRIHSASETSNGLAENRRQQEDLKIFESIWPKAIASLLSKIYSLSYKNNQ